MARDPVGEPRIALVHALAHSVAPVREAFASSWPEARLCNLLDDSLSADLAAAGRLDPAMTRRFEALGDYAAFAGADAILFTRSAFGPCIDLAAGAGVVALAQFSLARAADAVRRAAPSTAVLTTPGGAVRALRAALVRLGKTAPRPAGD